LLPALLAGPAAGATEQERLECLTRTRREYGTCLRDAQERCRTEFEGRLGGCFPGPECPTACLGAQEACMKEPVFERNGCRIACQADGRVARQGCRVEVDREACRRTARVKAIKCKDQCNRRAAPAIQRCRDEFSDCLGVCAKQE
jgi:hypothetical protein